MIKREMVELAEEIIKLDRKRDELYEKLLLQYGSQAHAFLRYIQNHTEMSGGVQNDEKSAS
ncbi:hypothetical protein HNQ94_000908 [Salirhabdus euzebyi]|uniref:Uncharacterized protein n=1 Tax=Salirhabdus euzebyi TaxID=394506 RepID=A0A841Q1X3_9BACI|nr:hypothetical protein [Salirhabdus euzebyi]